MVTLLSEQVVFRVNSGLHFSLYARCSKHSRCPEGEVNTSDMRITVDSDGTRPAPEDVLV